MIKSMMVTNYRGKSLEVTLSEAEPSHGLLIKNITGLGPSDAILNYSDFASNDGSEFNSARLEKRPIQITFMLTANENTTVEEARHRTYVYFPTKKQVRLVFKTDTRTLYCYGRVEHNTPDIFQKQELEVIDIVCGDPYFYKYTDGGEDKSVDISLVTGAFSSEYSNPEDETDESLDTYFTNEGTPNLEFGKYSSSGILTENLINEGDVETGFEVDIYFGGAIDGNIVISNSSQEMIRIKTSKIEELLGREIAAGDVIHLSTDPKRRYLNIVSGGQTYNILNALDFDNLTWLYLNPGDNLISYYVDSGLDNTQATYRYKTLYIGI